MVICPAITPETFYIGRAKPGVTGFTGKLAELVVVGRAIIQTEVDFLLAYAQPKWLQ